MIRVLVFAILFQPPPFPAPDGMALLPPTILVQPRSQSIPRGGTATLSVTAVGGTLGYQWFQGPSGFGGNPINGAIFSSFTTPALSTSTNYWVRVCNEDGCTPSDTAVITVEDETRTITVSSPNGGESWMAESIQEITWNSTGFSAPQAWSQAGATAEGMKIEYSIDGGASYTTLARETENDGRYTWVIPDRPSAFCLVRISASASADIFDVSNASFSIIPATDPGFRLDRTQLFFGAAGSTCATADQTVSIHVTGAAPIHWSAASSDAWLDITPQSGVGDGVIRLGVDPSGLAPGAYDGRMTITDSDTGNYRTVAVSLTIFGEGESSAPWGAFDTPLENATVVSSIPVTGWALDDIGVESIKIFMKPEGGAGGTGFLYIGDAVFVEGARPDIELSYPDEPFPYRAGWGYILLTNVLPNGGNGAFEIRAVAMDLEGHEVALGTKTIICDNARAVRPFGAIDTPSQGGEAAGKGYLNFAWALTPPPKFIPAGGSTIWVFVDGKPVGHPSYGYYREDIAALFPGYRNADGAVGFFVIDTTAYTNGVHTIDWRITDSAGEIDGLGSRYFTVLNAADRGGGVEDISAQRMDLAGLWKRVSGHSDGNTDRITPVYATLGYDLFAPAVPIYPGADGKRRIEIRETGRISLFLGAADAAYLVVGSELRTLPVGSAFDPTSRILSWQPGPGFLGDYEFILLSLSSTGWPVAKFLTIKIAPKVP